ncbi:NnrS family protein [uncultured Paraglaciecola sp.]|uniref:NnrS family protein n=1 Tax=uncultured Paraglaciecola sp. TaxID=1765024 RepID=UPI0025F68C9C|nr:NnrS family protein [uncultured Paraglaciecola sp.]
MLNITDLKEELTLTPILRLGFRPLFLFGSLFAFLAMLIWLLTLSGQLSFSPVNGVFWWHSHEMLFGFVPAIIASFLLTAVQTWTNIPSIKGNKLLFLSLIWLLPRTLLAFNPDINLLFTMTADLAFLPLTALLLAVPLIKIRQYRNLVFVPVLLLMTTANVLTYLPQFDFSASLATQGFHGMVLLVTFLVAFLGGRVIPMFTANGTSTAKVSPLKWLEILALLSIVILFGLIISGLTHNQWLLAILCFSSALLNLIRQLRWRPWVTLKVPLVWSLHFAMIFAPIGLLLMGIHFIFGSISLSTALHSLTVGLIGGMISAMTARVSLGHTGRKLKVGHIMQLAFMAIILSALTRSLLVALWPQYSLQFWLVSAVLWCITFGSFVALYLPILSAPRIDGRPG